MKVFILVKETYREVGIDSYWEHENLSVYLNKQDAEFELKYVCKPNNSDQNVVFYIEDMEVN